MFPWYVCSTQHVGIWMTAFRGMSSWECALVQSASTKWKKTLDRHDEYRELIFFQKLGKWWCFIFLPSSSIVFGANFRKMEKFFFEKIVGKYFFSLQFQLNLLFLRQLSPISWSPKIEKKHIFVWQCWLLQLLYYPKAKIFSRREEVNAMILFSIGKLDKVPIRW